MAEDPLDGLPTADKTLAVAGVVGVAGLFPLIGPVAASFLQWGLGRAMERRWESWLRDLAVRVRALEDGDHDIGALGEDEEFVTMLNQASQAALRTHDEGKRQALLAAIDHTARRDLTISSDVALTFVRYIDELTPAHLRMLAVRAGKGPFDTVIADPAFRDSAAGREFLNGLQDDLIGRRLVYMKPPRQGPVLEGEPLPRGNPVGLTELGKLFMGFIEDPVIKP